MAVLGHAARYRLVTVESTARLIFGAEGDEAARAILNRLVRTGLLDSRPLYGAKRGYQLAAMGARLVGEPEEAARPLGPQALPMAYGVLSFCCLGPVLREKLTRSELRAKYPALGLPFNPYYLDEEAGATRLAQTFVDLGGEAMRLVHKLRDRHRRNLNDATYRELVYLDQVAVAIVTTSASKKAAILEAITVQQYATPVRIEVFPDLLGLLPDLRYGNTAPSDDKEPS